MTDHEIRRAHLDEARELAELHARTEIHAYAHIFPADAPPPAVDEHTREFREELRRGTGFVAVVNDEIAGAVLALPDRSEPATGLLSRLCVAPELAGRGIGTRLYQACLQEFVDLGFTRATLWVLERHDRACRWYERLGWTVTGERRPIYEPAGIDEVRYRLTVPIQDDWSSATGRP